MSLDSLIYVIDDDGDDANWMIDGLHEAGFENVVHAINGEQAIRQFSKDKVRPNLIFLDNRMPLLGGFGVWSEIDSLVISGKVKLCVISAQEPDWFHLAKDHASFLLKGDPFKTRDEIVHKAKTLLLS